MTEPTLTDAERETVEACAKAIWQSWHPGKEMSPSDLMAHHETEAEAEAALRALNPGARLPGGLVVVRSPGAAEAEARAKWATAQAKRDAMPECDCEDNFCFSGEFRLGQCKWHRAYMAPPSHGNGG